MSQEFKTGMKVQIKPVEVYTVLFVHPDGRVQLQHGKGGASCAWKPEQLRPIPTLVDPEEEKYWLERAEEMKEYLERRGR